MEERKNMQKNKITVTTRAKGEAILRYLAENEIYKVQGESKGKTGAETLYINGLDYRFTCNPTQILTSRKVETIKRFTEKQFEELKKNLLDYMVAEEYTVEEQKRAVVKLMQLQDNWIVLPFTNKDLYRNLRIELKSRLGSLVGYKVKVVNKQILCTVLISYGTNVNIPDLQYPAEAYGEKFKISGVSLRLTPRGEILPVQFRVADTEYVLDNVYLYRKVNGIARPFLNTVTDEVTNLASMEVATVCRTLEKYQKSILPLPLYKTL